MEHAGRPAFPDSAGDWHKRILSMTWPVILANVTIPLVGLVDVWVMGRIPDPTYIAAVTLGAALFSAVYWLFGFLRMGTTGLVAQAWGRNDPAQVTATIARAATIALALGALIISLQWPLQYLLFALFDASAQTESLAATYYSIRIWGAPALLLTLAELGLLFGLQKMRATLMLSVGLNVTNVALNMFFVLGLGMDVAGVALATLLSEWSAALFGGYLCLNAMRNAGIQHTLSAEQFKRLWQKGAATTFGHVSANLILRTFFVQLPFFVGTVVATSMGDVALAAHGVLMQLFFVMTYSLDGFAQTSETLTGYAYGSADPRRVRQSTLYSGWWGLVGAGLTALFFATAGYLCIDELTRAEPVREFAYTYLPWLIAAPFLCLLAFLFDGIFIGTTHIVEMRNSMLLAAACWAATLWLSLPALQYHGVWLAMSVFMLVRSALLGYFYPRIERNAHSAKA